MKVLFIVSFFFVTAFAATEFYSSIDQLVKLFETETKILEDFQEVQAKINDIKTYLEQKLSPWIAENNEAKNDTQAYVTNTLNAYLLLKRNVYDLRMVTGKLSKFTNDLQEKIKNLEEKALVEEREVTGAVGGMIRAQKAYQLKNEDLVEGVIDGLVTRKPLTPHDIFILGKSAGIKSENNFFVKSHLETAKKKIEKGEDFLNEVDMAELDDVLNKLPEKMGDPFDETYTLKGFRERTPDIYLVQKTCRGNLTRTPKEMKLLRCRYVSFTPFAKLARFKLEEVSIEPYVVIYHQVISDKEIDRLIEIARTKKSRALLGKTGQTIDDDRLAQLMWMYKEHYPAEANLLDARFEDMTGLSMETSEPLQIQNYGVGGHYYAHYDVIEGNETMDLTKRHRIATLMLYLKNVVKGGDTVFPYMKIRAQPQKGSAIFWYNLKRSGHHEPYSLHSGCPLMVGNKWVANKWIHNTGQWFKRPCIVENFVKKDFEAEMRLNFKE